MRYARFLLLLAFTIALPPLPRVTAAGIPLEQEVQAGQGFVNAFTAQYGLSENQHYREMAESALARLATACGERPELQWKICVLKANPENPVGRNASAWPGGFLVTDDAFLDTLAKAAGNDEKEMTSLLAGVLAHEIAHIVRHDTDALVPVFFKQTDAAPTQLLFTLKTTKSETPADGAVQLKAENACDRDGAFYLLRAGYRIEDMMDVFRRLGEAEVDEVLFNGALDHARAAERVGTILTVKEQVQEDERCYEEATNILRLGLGGQMLQLATDDLDMVALHFPKMLPVRHARAVLAHSRYLAKIPPERLGGKPAFSFYRFRPSRSLPTDDLEQALREYAAILKDYEATQYKGLGPTAAAYALALSHAGQTREALTWAQRATVLAPADWTAWNTLGIVLQQSDKPKDAVVALRKAVSLAIPALPESLANQSAPTTAATERAVWRYAQAVPPVTFGAALFNLGRALKDARDKNGAAQAFGAYLATDSTSDWAQIAQAMLKSLRTKAPAVPTVLAGITPGLPDGDLRTLLGDPEAIAEADPDAQVWRYRRKGISVFLDENGRTRAALLVAPFSGEIGAKVKIGATAAQLTKSWGQPWTLRKGEDGEAWGYPAEGVVFLLQKGRVAKAVWLPTTPTTSGLPAAAPITPGETAAQVKEALGAPDSGEGQENNGGLWVYERLGVRVRFDRQGSVALVTLVTPSSMAVNGVKVGDAAAAIRRHLGADFVAGELDNAATYTFPGQGVAYAVRNDSVAVITLFPRQG